MPRSMTPAMAAALAAPVVRPAILVAMQFAVSTAYAWTGNRPLTWGGMTFEGVGDLADISTMSEGSTVDAEDNVTIGLSSIPSDLMSDVLTEVRILGDVTIWLACFDLSGAIVPDPIVAFQGNMDGPEIEDGGDTCTAQLSIENVLVELNRAVYRRFTNDDQQMDYPGDTGFQHVPGVQERITFWGRSPSSTNNV